MERAHLVLFLVVLVVSVLHSCADAQAVTISNPPLGITLRDNLKATMSVMLVAFLSAFVFMGFFSLYLRHCSYGYGGAAASNNNPIAAAADLCQKGFNREVIDKCPLLSYSSVKDLKIGKGSLECAVCLTEFHDYDNIRLLPKCHHVFHPDCIDAWLLSHMNCPVCRSTLTPPDVAADNITIPIPDPSATPPDSGHEMEQPDEEGQSSSSNVTTVITAEGEADSVAQEVVVIPVARESRMLEKFPRSHSTGHSLGEKVRVVDRYTLRLPDHVRRHILANQGIINRRLVPTSTGSSDHNNRVVLPVHGVPTQHATEVLPPSPIYKKQRESF